MGIYANLIGVSSQVIGPSAAPRAGLDRASADTLRRRIDVIDPALNSTNFGGRDEVQNIPHQVTSGVGDTYTLTFSLPRLQDGVFTTAAIAYNATAATMTTAIDVAATAAGITDWTNGDIDVVEAAAAGVSDGIVQVTFDGASVTEEPVDLMVMTCTGWTQDGVIATGTPGQTDRNACQALYELGVISGTVWYSGNTPSLTVPTNLLVKRPRMGLLHDLAVQATLEDGSDLIYDALRALYQGLPAK